MALPTLQSTRSSILRTKLKTIDEATEAVVSTACQIVEQAHAASPFDISAMLWGAGNYAALDSHDRALARRHRRQLDDVIALGYGYLIVDQLDGIASATGLDEGRFARWTRPSDPPS
jgi:hypothetical protein